MFVASGYGGGGACRERSGKLEVHSKNASGEEHQGIVVVIGVAQVGRWMESALLMIVMVICR